MGLELSKLSGITHETTAKYGEGEITVRFRGTSVRAHRELEKSEAFYTDDDVQKIRIPEYLAVYVIEIESGNTVVKPDLDYWLDGQPEFLQAVFDAVSGAQNPPKATPSESETTS